jgi:hypothetical protein
MRKRARLGVGVCAAVLSGFFTPATVAQAYLLDEGQQERCLEQHVEDEVFDEYWYRWVGEDVWVGLQCGNARWGYVHIAHRHQTEWQAKLDAGRAAGWNPEEQGIHTWDDLMAFAVREAVERPGHRNIYTDRAKGCGIVELGFVPDGEDEESRFHFKATAVWDTDFGSIISAYPTVKSHC